MKTSKITSIFLPLFFFQIIIGVNLFPLVNNDLTNLPVISGNWESPVELGSFTYSDNVRNTFILNDTAFILVDVYGMVIVDISNPLNPQYLGRYAEYSKNVQVIDDIAYLTSGNGFFIVNVSVPSSPSLLGENNTFDCDGLYVDGDLAFVGCRYYGMVIFNISNPTMPDFVGEYVNGSNQDYDDIFVANNTAYIADYQGGNLKIINVTDPYNPEIHGIYDYDTVEGGPNDVFVVDDICYLSDYDGGLKIINVSDPESVVTLTTYNSGGWVSGVFVSDNIAYVSDYLTGIRILNVSSPSSPVLLGSFYDPSENAYSIFFANSILYVGWGMEGLKIIDPGYDSDEDGWSDQVEIYLHQTDPDDPNSFPDVIAPVITIISPQPSTSYGIDAPDFNISIIESDLDATWYTIQGGLFEYQFTGLNGTIDQEGWDVTPEGEISITFYAEDGAGNIGSESVVVIKSIPTQPEIPGYNIYLFLLGILSVAIILLVKKMKKF